MAFIISKKISYNITMKSIKKQIILLVVLILLVIVIISALMDSNSKSIETIGTVNSSAFNSKNSTFEINNIVVSLKNGYEEKRSPDDKYTISTRYFGNEVRVDLNRDGLIDYGYIVVQNSGGSGSFYYEIIALSNKDKTYTTNAFLLGDRIAPQSSNLALGKLVVNFVDRKPNQSFSVQPSVGKTVTFEVNSVGKVIQK